MFELINKGGLYCVEASISLKNQDKLEVVELVLDSSAVLTIIDTSIVDVLGYSSRDAFKKSNLDGAAGQSKGYLIKIPKFRCFNFEVQNFTVACHDMNSKLGVAGILGMNFLSHFRMDIDWNTGEIFSIKTVSWVGLKKSEKTEQLFLICDDNCCRRNFSWETTNALLPTKRLNCLMTFPFVMAHRMGLLFAHPHAKNLNTDA